MPRCGMCANLRAFEILDLADTAVTDAGIACLSKLKHLESVTLPGKTVSKEAASRLQRKLPHCSIIRGTMSFGPLGSALRLPNARNSGHGIGGDALPSGQWSRIFRTVGLYGARLYVES